MVDVLLFHHVQGLTEGVREFADELREAGHDVTLPDLFGGRTFSTVEEGVAQQRSGARGALFYHSAVPTSEFGGRWPDGVPLQMHIMVDDPWDDLEVMRGLEAEASGELFTYDGDRHLFTDSSAADYDAVAARLVMSRTLDFLARLG